MKALARLVALVVVATIAFSTVALAAPGQFGDWAVARSVEAIPGTDPSFNSSSLDGCPFVSPDGKLFFMASNRPGALGGLDIYITTRWR
jgi:hypothetical protein